VVQNTILFKIILFRTNYKLQISNSVNFRLLIQDIISKINIKLNFKFIFEIMPRYPIYSIVNNTWSLWIVIRWATAGLKLIKPFFIIVQDDG